MSIHHCGKIPTSYSLQGSPMALLANQNELFDDVSLDAIHTTKVIGHVSFVGCPFLG
jgi:hypothetical protein